MKKCERHSGTTYLSDIYSPVQRRFLSQSPDNLTVGGRLRRERLLRKLTLEGMADVLGISATYLGSVERGTRPLSRQLEKKLHEKLGLSYDFLLDGLDVTSTMITQYVRESSGYSSHHNIDVLLKICEPNELEDCYNLIHTYLIKNRKSRGPISKTPEDPFKRK